jgi:hypothetical protein
MPPIIYLCGDASAPEVDTSSLNVMSTNAISKKNNGRFLQLDLSVQLSQKQKVKNGFY